MQNEAAAINDVISLYFKGTYDGNADMLRQAFHPNAHISGTINDDYCDWTLSDFIARVTAEPTAANKNEHYDKKIIFVDSIGNIAMAKARVVIGETIFTDLISLLKLNGQWCIRNKLFTSIQF